MAKDWCKECIKNLRVDKRKSAFAVTVGIWCEYTVLNRAPKSSVHMPSLTDDKRATGGPPLTLQLGRHFSTDTDTSDTWMPGHGANGSVGMDSRPGSILACSIQTSSLHPSPSSQVLSSLIALASWTFLGGRLYS